MQNGRVTNFHVIKFAGWVSRALLEYYVYSDKVADSYRNLYSTRVFSISNLNEWTAIDKEELINGAALNLFETYYTAANRYSSNFGEYVVPFPFTRLRLPFTNLEENKIKIFPRKKDSKRDAKIINDEIVYRRYLSKNCCWPCERIELNLSASCPEILFRRWPMNGDPKVEAGSWHAKYNLVIDSRSRD